jgi:hypothetical protein
MRDDLYVGASNSDCMSLHAFDDVDDALQAARGLLTPIDRGLWLRLALVVFFIGGGGGFSFPGGFNAPASDVPTDGGAPAPDVGTDLLVLVAAIVVAALLFGLVLLFVGSVMEFVFVESLGTETPQVRAYWGRHWRRGLRLFGFRLGIGLLGLLLFGGLALLAFAPVLLGGAGVGAALGLFVVLVPVFLILALVFGVVNSLTTAFVVPVMMIEDRGVLSAWRRLWPTVRGRWKETAAYVVVAWLFGVGLGIAAGIAIAVAGFVLAIPFLVLGAVVGFGLSFSTPALVVIGLLAVVYALLMLVVVALVRVPVQTYLRYYALFVLGDVEPAFDAVPDQRRAVRSDGTTGEAL